MEFEALQRHWALLIALIIAIVIGVMAMAGMLSRSAAGRLRQAVRVLRKRDSALKKQQRVTRAAKARADKLRSNAARVKPRLVAEAQGAFEDASLSLQVASDQALIARNHVRKVIFEEYPPDRQGSLMQRYLPGKDPERGFRFD